MSSHAMQCWAGSASSLARSGHHRATLLSLLRREQQHAREHPTSGSGGWAGCAAAARAAATAAAADRSSVTGLRAGGGAAAAMASPPAEVPLPPAAPSRPNCASCRLSHSSSWSCVALAPDVSSPARAQSSMLSAKQALPRHKMVFSGCQRCQPR